MDRSDSYIFARCSQCDYVVVYSPDGEEVVRSRMDLSPPFNWSHETLNLNKFPNSGTNFKFSNGYKVVRGSRKGVLEKGRRRVR